MSVPHQWRLLFLINDSWSNRENSNRILSSSFKNSFQKHDLKGLSHLTKNTSCGPLEFSCQICRWQKLVIQREAETACQKWQKFYSTNAYTSHAIYTSYLLLLYHPLWGRGVAIPNSISCFTACIKQHYCSKTRYTFCVCLDTHKSFELWDTPIWDTLALKVFVSSLPASSPFCHHCRY